MAESSWNDWMESWNNLKREEFLDYMTNNEEAVLYRAAPAEHQAKMRTKWVRFFEGEDFPIVEAETVKLPTAKDQDDLAKIEQNVKENMVEAEVARQADLLDAADQEHVKKQVLLTEQQQLIASLVDSAEAEAPSISVNELGARLMMLIPKVIKESRPDYSYKWASVDSLQAELHTFGGMWEMVARVNHNHLPGKLFGPEGSIMYKGASVLVFTRRSTTDYLNKQTVQELDLRVKQSIDGESKTYRDPRGREQVRLELIDKEPPNKVGEVELKQETFGLQADGSQGDYDFPDTGTEGN